MSRKVEPDLNVLSRSLGYYGAKENFLREKWTKRLKSLRGADFFQLSEIIDEFLDDLETPAELFFTSGEFR